MSIALMFLKRFWKELIIVLVIAAAVLYMRGLYSTIDKQKETIAQLTTANQILKDNNDKLEKTIAANNEAISKMAAGAKETNKAFSTLNTTVKAQTSSLEERLRRILQDKKPQTCEDTIQYLLEAAKGFK